MLPVNSGRTGRAFLAFSGVQGDRYDEIRRKGYNAGLSERVTESFSATAPVFGFDGNLVGALTISAPRSRYSETYLGDLIPACITAAREISRCLGFEPSTRQWPFAGRSFRDRR